MRLDIYPQVAAAWASHYENWNGCLRCKIGAMAFKHVFARGVLPCDILLIGEAPGDTEDLTGQPFVGKAGKVLDEMLAETSKQVASLFSWAITNTVLCKPSDERGAPFRAPYPEEKANCRPRLDYFVASIAKPRGIVCLGRHASESSPFWVEGNEGVRVWIPHICVRHPAYILYRGGSKGVSGGEIFRAEVAKIVAFVQAHT